MYPSAQIENYKLELSSILVNLCMAIIIKESDRRIRMGDSTLISSVKNLYTNRQSNIAARDLAQEGISIIKRFVAPNFHWDNRLDNVFDIFSRGFSINEVFYQQVKELIEVIERFPLSSIYTLEIKKKILEHIENLKLLAFPKTRALVRAVSGFNWEDALAENVASIDENTTTQKEGSNGQTSSSFFPPSKNVKQTKFSINAILEKDHSREPEGAALTSLQPSTSGTNTSSTSSTIQIQNNIELKKEFVCLLLRLWAIVEKRNLPKIKGEFQFDSFSQGFFLFSSSSGSTISCESKVLKELFIDLMNKIQTELNLSLQIEEINSIFDIFNDDVIINAHFHEKTMKFIAVIKEFCAKRGLDPNKFEVITNHLNIIQGLSYPHGSLALEEVFESVINQELEPRNSSQGPVFENYKLSSSSTSAGPSSAAPHASVMAENHRKRKIEFKTDEEFINWFVEDEIKSNSQSLASTSLRPSTSGPSTSKATEANKSVTAREKIIDFQKELGYLTIKLNRVVNGKIMPKIDVVYGLHNGIPMLRFTVQANTKVFMTLGELAKGGISLISAIKVSTSLPDAEEALTNIFSIFTAKDFSMDAAFNEQVKKFIGIIREFIKNPKNIVSVEGQEEIEKHLTNLQRLSCSALLDLETIDDFIKGLSPVPLSNPSTKLQVNLQVAPHSLSLKRAHVWGPSKAMESAEYPVYKRSN